MYKAVAWRARLRLSYGIGQGEFDVVRREFVVIGGSTRPNSSSEVAARICGARAEDMNVHVSYFLGRDLMFPIYDTESPDRAAAAQEFLDRLRAADGLVISSPGYHGALSGMIKNALDYIEELRDDERPYLDGRTVGCIGVAYGWQAAVSTLNQLRQIAHALRGWPTPVGAAVNAAVTGWEEVSGEAGASAAEHIRLIADQMISRAS